MDGYTDQKNLDARLENHFDSSVEALTLVKLDEAQDGQLALANGEAILSADFVRDGYDLILDSGPDGGLVYIPGYFSTETPPALNLGDAGVISADLAGKLAGPMAPAQVAQIGIGAQQSVTTETTGESIGSVNDITGTVQATRVDGTQVTLSQGDPIYQGDVIETAEASTVGIVFADDTLFALEADGRMVMDEMVYDPDSQTGVFETTVVKGVFSFVSGQTAKVDPDAMVIHTPSTTIGIRGTSGIGKTGVVEETAEADGLQAFAAGVGGGAELAQAPGPLDSFVLMPDPGSKFVGEVVIGGKTVNTPFGSVNIGNGLVSDPVPLGPAEVMNTFGGAMVNLSTMATKQAEVRVQRAEQQARQAQNQAEQQKAEAEQTKEQAAEAKAEAANAEDAAAKAEAEAEAAKAEAEALKAAAEAETDPEVKAAAEAKAADAAARAAEAEAKAEAESAKAAAIAEKAGALQNEAEAKDAQAAEAEQKAQEAAQQQAEAQEFQDAVQQDAQMQQQMFEQFKQTGEIDPELAQQFMEAGLAGLADTVEGGEGKEGPQQGEDIFGRGGFDVILGGAGGDDLGGFLGKIGIGIGIGIVEKPIIEPGKKPFERNDPEYVEVDFAQTHVIEDDVHIYSGGSASTNYYYNWDSLKSGDGGTYLITDDAGSVNQISFDSMVNMQFRVDMATNTSGVITVYDTSAFSTLHATINFTGISQFLLSNVTVSNFSGNNFPTDAGGYVQKLSGLGAGETGMGIGLSDGDNSYAVSEGNRIIFGNGGNDTFTFSATDSGGALLGNAGTDTFNINKLTDKWDFDGGDGADVFTYSASPASMTDSLNVYFKSSSVLVQDTGGTKGNTLTMDADDNFTASAQADNLYLTGGSYNNIYGGAGNDSFYVSASLFSSSSFTLLDGGTDSGDKLTVQVSDATSFDLNDFTNRYSGMEEFTITGSSSSAGVTITGLSAWNTTIIGSNYDDTLRGGNDNADVISGGSGNDTLIGANGMDTLTGGSGADIFKYEARVQNSEDNIRDFSGSAGDGDKFQFDATEFGISSIIYEEVYWDGSASTLSLTNDNANVIVITGGNATTYTDVLNMLTSNPLHTASNAFIVYNNSSNNDAATIFHTTDLENLNGTNWEIARFSNMTGDLSDLSAADFSAV